MVWYAMLIFCCLTFLCFVEVCGVMHMWADGWVGGWMDGWMDGWIMMGECMHACMDDV